MAKKRKDQRFAVDATIEKQVLSLLGSEAQDLIVLRNALNEKIQKVSDSLPNTTVDMLSQNLALKSGRRGEAHFEIDPDGQVVLVVSYGGEPVQALSRTDLKPAWNKREDAPKPKPKAAPQKKKGFVKTSVAVSPTKVVPASSMDDIEDILDAFSDEDASPAPSGEPSEAKAEEAEVHEGYTPTNRRLRRIPGHAVQRGRGNSKTLTSIMAMDQTKNGDDPS